MDLVRGINLLTTSWLTQVHINRVSASNLSYFLIWLGKQAAATTTLYHISIAIYVPIEGRRNVLESDHVYPNQLG